MAAPVAAERQDDRLRGAAERFGEQLRDEIVDDRRVRRQRVKARLAAQRRRGQLLARGGEPRA